MATEQISEESDDSESEPWCYKPVAQTNEACGKQLAGETAESISSAFQKSQDYKEATLEHFFALSPQTISHTEAVYDMVRKIHGKPPDDPMNDLDVNVAIWRVFMDATLKAAAHLGNDHDVSLRHVKNSFLEICRTTFFGDSVLRLGKMGPNPVESWEKQIQWYSETNQLLQRTESN